MAKLEKLENLIKTWLAQTGCVAVSEENLLEFSKQYSILSPDEAEILRSKFDAKHKLRFFRVASSVFCKNFDEADDTKKRELLEMLYALYSLDNLDFGYDTLLTINDTLSLQNQVRNIAVDAWEKYEKLTSRQIAKRNLGEIHEALIARQSAQNSLNRPKARNPSPAS